MIMSEPRLNFVQCLNTLPADPGSHRMAYREWGDPANPRVLLCVHGLSRQGQDFATLARALCSEYRVVSVDVVGRGHSDWLNNPMGYGMPQYASDMVVLLARLNAQEVNWLGTSMGGLIGIVTLGLLGGAERSRVKRFIINDIAPTINPQSVQRIGAYLGKAPDFASLDEAADYFWSVSQGFGSHTREQWLDLSRPMIKPEGSRFVVHYDPRIAEPFNAVTPEAAAAGEAMLWSLYDRIDAHTLLIRGELSDLLSPETAQQMTQRGPKPRLFTVEGVGHAPMFVQPEQIERVRAFLRES